MKVAITTQKELRNPHLELDVNLEKGTLSVALTYECPECAGYGCHGRSCDDCITLEPENILTTLGPEAKTLLTDLFGRCLSSSR